MKLHNKVRYKKIPASFTVEASFVMPLVIGIIIIALHLAIDLQNEVVEETKKTPAVKTLQPVEEKRGGTQG